MFMEGFPSSEDSGMRNSIIQNYKDSYVAFLDVLGFKEMVHNKEDKKLTTYFNAVNQVITGLRNIIKKQNIGYIVISDSIILTLSKALDVHSDIENLRQLCIAIRRIQLELAINDIWLRGAVTSGQTYFDQTNNQIVGPAYINAYLLEDELAVFPRVILDNKLLSDLDFENSDQFIITINDGDDDKNVLYDWRKNISVSKHTIEQDVPLFIDYLSDILDVQESLHRVINNIKSSMYSNTRIFKKFRWVADYLYTILLREENKNREISIDYRKQIEKF